MNRLTIEGIPASFSDESLRDLCVPFGTVVEAKVWKGPHGQPLRIGTVTMATVAAADGREKRFIDTRWERKFS